MASEDLEENPLLLCGLGTEEDGALSEETPRNLKRNFCQICNRPLPVCLCSFFPAPPLSVKTQVIILQHPHEKFRTMRTVPLLQRCLEDGKCHVVEGRNFWARGLDHVFLDPRNLLLFPADEAVDLRIVADEDASASPNPEGYPEAAPAAGPRTLVVLDGTWRFAKDLYRKNKPLLDHLKKVQFGQQDLFISRYRIRKQPNESALCTLEAVAVALSILEGRPEILPAILKPLDGLVSLQFDYRDQKGVTREESDDNDDDDDDGNGQPGLGDD